LNFKGVRLYFCIHRIRIHREYLNDPRIWDNGLGIVSRMHGETFSVPVKFSLTSSDADTASQMLLNFSREDRERESRYIRRVRRTWEKRPALSIALATLQTQLKWFYSQKLMW
jgi:hypothetical protein